ncbi:MAG: succinate--CoA ligase subunit alpha [Parvibaculum sp.]
MSILLDRTARVVILGITGKFGRFSVGDMVAFGTNVVAGVAPGRGGVEVDGVPVFSNVQDAVRETGADTALAYVPAPVALDAVIEAFEAGCRLVAYPGDGLPVLDAMEMRAAAKANGGHLVGPNSPGIVSPGQAKLGFMPSFCYRPGPIGVISRSGSLSYEATFRLSEAGLGQTTCIGIGGDPVKGVTAAEAVALFDTDPDTRAIVYLGEIGGNDEYAVAEYARRPGAKPVAALLVGRTAPLGKKMGHAAALIGSYADTWQSKTDAMAAAGVHVARSLTELTDAARQAIGAVELAS